MLKIFMLYYKLGQFHKLYLIVANLKCLISLYQILQIVL
jgi:hypothetical protein